MTQSYYSNSISKILSKNKITPRVGAAFLQRGQAVMIYGAGNCGRDVQRALSQHGIAIDRFLDKGKTPGTIVQGVPVCHPDDNSLSGDIRRKVCVIIAIFNRDTDILSIDKELRQYGYGQIVTFLEFHRNFPDELGDRFWLTATNFYDSLEHIVSDGLSIWEDDQSRSLYQATLNFRITADYSCLPVRETGVIYFDEGLPRWNKPMSFIDCGSFDGDTLQELRKAYGEARFIAAFEPDPDNFLKLHTRVKMDTGFAQNMVLSPCGIWSKTTQMRFSSEKAESSHLSTSGEYMIQCVSLDENLHGFDPTLIKMDIEGAEYEALLGAQELIAASKPGLAISVYHRPEHIWQIPLLVKHWDLGYKFYLRTYGYSGFDTVMYAIPQ